MRDEVSKLFIIADQDPDHIKPGEKLTAYQMWEDGERQRADTAEVIIIMANRSTCRGRPNENGYVFSYHGG